MKYDEFVKLDQQGLNYWWYRARRRLLRLGIEKYVRASTSLMILDLASACGDNYSVCRKYGKIYGIDISEHSIRFCKQKNIDTMVRGDVQDIPFADEIFDVVVAFDVFEHLERDTESILESARVLRKNGILLVNVPAYMALYSNHDKAFEHIRRYSASEMNMELKAAGFRVLYRSYWSFFIFPLVYAYRKVFANKNNTQVRSNFHLNIPKYIENIFSILSLIEFSAMSKRFSFPFGVSLFLIATKEI